MKKNWAAALIILLAIGATFTVVKFGVKKAVDTSLDHSQNSPSQPGAADHTASQAPSDASVANGQAGNAKPGDASGVAGQAAGEHAASGSAQSGAAGASSTTQVAGEVKKVAPPENNCFSVEYRHTKEAQNKDIEDFLDYSNAYPVPHNINEKSVCVKVNNKPVAFKMNKNKSQDEVMIGAVVGPESVIKVSYCVGKAACKESCAVKSNRFMDDMMSDAGDEDEFKDSWGDSNSAAHTAQKKELQGKVKELRSVASENKDLAQRSVIRTWETIQEQSSFCKK